MSTLMKEVDRADSNRIIDEDVANDVLQFANNFAPICFDYLELDNVPSPIMV